MSKCTSFAALGMVHFPLQLATRHNCTQMQHMHTMHTDGQTDTHKRHNIKIYIARSFLRNHTIYTYTHGYSIYLLCCDSQRIQSRCVNQFLIFPQQTKCKTHAYTRIQTHTHSLTIQTYVHTAAACRAIAVGESVRGRERERFQQFVDPTWKVVPKLTFDAHYDICAQFARHISPV